MNWLLIWASDFVKCDRLTFWHLSFHTSDGGQQRESVENQLGQRHGAIPLLQTRQCAEHQHPCVCPLQRLVHQHSRGEQQASGDVPGERLAPPNLHHRAPEFNRLWIHMWESRLSILRRKFGYWTECKIYCTSAILIQKISKKDIMLLLKSTTTVC